MLQKHIIGLNEVHNEFFVLNYIQIRYFIPHNSGRSIRFNSMIRLYFLLNHWSEI